jgi:hypothetical protein
MPFRPYLLVADVLERVRDDADAHVDEVGRRHLKHRLRELLAVLIDLLQNNRTGNVMTAVMAGCIMTPAMRWGAL